MRQLKLCFPVGRVNAKIWRNWQFCSRLFQVPECSIYAPNWVSQVRSKDTAAPIGAFMWPLHWSMWVGIFVTLHLTALFLTLYEWNSPFGMTPHGRNRLRVFSYSSALNLCYAILFGRTVATKVRRDARDQWRDGSLKLL